MERCKHIGLFWILMGILSSHAMAIEFRPDSTEFRTSNPEHALDYWKFQVGDSPLDPSTHEPIWSQPDFDDSAWERVNLSPYPDAGDMAFIRGWCGRGHAGYWGYAWYRSRVNLTLPPYAQQLAIAGPDRVDDAFQVFLNGRLLGGLGNFSEITPAPYYNQPTRFRFAPPQRDQLTSYPVVIAFRIWMGPNSLLNAYQLGGLRSIPFLGTESAVELHYQQSWHNLTHSRLPLMACAISFLASALVAFCLIVFDHPGRAYFWMASILVMEAAVAALRAFAVWVQSVSILQDKLIVQCLLGPLVLLGWFMVWTSWLGCKTSPWMRISACCLTLALIASNGLFTLYPNAVAFNIASLLARFGLFVLLFRLVIPRIRRLGLEAWLIVPAAILLVVGAFGNDISLFLDLRTWYFWGEQISLTQITSLTFSVTVTVVLLRRLLLSVRRQRLIELDSKRAQVQSDFVAAVSHEFRSPLTTLKTITDLLIEGRIENESLRRESYTYLNRETNRLQRLVEDLLDFGRMESGRKQYRLAEYDPFQLVQTAVADLSELANAQGFNIEMNLLSVPATIHADEEALRCAVRNLVENAMKYSPQCRTVWVDVWVDGVVNSEHVSISVRDEGMGIDASEQRAIFQKFVRGDAAKKKGIKGTGIGLAMVQEISEAMGGEIRLQSEVGVGSTFTIKLPVTLEPGCQWTRVE